MNTANIILWSEVTAFPLLSMLTFVPLVMMVAVLLSPSPGIALRFGFVGTLTTLLLSIYLFIVFDPSREGIQLFEQFQNIGINYSAGIDGANILFIPLTAILAVLANIYLLTTRRVNDRIQIACLLGYEGILIGAFVAMNALQFWFWCFLELIPLTLMTIRAGSGQNRRWVVALLLQHWGSGLFMTLIGFLLLSFSVMGSGDTLSFDWLVLKNQDESLLEYGTLIFFLLFFGFAIRIPLFPFHGWLPVLAEHGTVASAAIFTVGIKLGIYAMIRFILPILPDNADYWSGFVITLGLIGIFYGALLALMQINIRRLIAFADISHAGTLIIGIFSFNVYGLGGSILLSTAFGLAIAGMLLSVGMIYKRTHTAYILRLGGMFEVSIGIALLFVLSALGTIVMPGTPGFDGAHLLLEGTIREYGWLVSIAILIGNVLIAAALLRTFQQIFTTAPKRPQVFRYSPFHSLVNPSPKNERIIAAIVCTLIMGIGLYTAPWIQRIDQYANVPINSHSVSYNTQHVDSMAIPNNTKDIKYE